MTTPYAMTYAGDRAIRAAHAAGLVSEELYQAHCAAIRECPNSWYNWYKAATRTAASANDDRMTAYLDSIDRETAAEPLTEAADAAEDWTPEGVPF